MELDFDKYCVVDGSPTTVLRAPRNPSKVASRKPSGRSKQSNNSTLLSKDFREISFNRYRSASCRDSRLGRSNEQSSRNSVLLYRGSEYVSSKEVNLLEKKNVYDIADQRKKIELSRDAVSEISFGIIDSLCSLEENSSVVERDRSLLMHQSEQSTSSPRRNQIQFLPESVMPHSSRDRELEIDLHKSLSAKIALPHSPSYSDVSSSRSISPKVRFNLSRKTFNPLVKTKSHRSPLSSVNRTGLETTSVETSMVCEDGPEKNTCDVEVIKSQHEKIKKSCSDAETSPAHLNGFLKLDNKQGGPSFEFSVKSTEECYIAKTSKVENMLTRVYTFRSLHQRRKSNVSGCGFRDSHKESTVLGQMHVSCRLCTEFNRDGTSNDKMVTEFVLYDTAHSRRKSTPSHDNSSGSQETIKASQVHDEHSSTVSRKKNEMPMPVKSKINARYKNSLEIDDLRLSNSQPLPPSELHPVQEIAAIVVEVPLEKRESLKFKTGDKRTDQPLPSLLELCQIEQAKEGSSDKTSLGTIHVVIPAGNHGSPSCETQGPSPLLERWRLGGGCDCGGWDMACPLNIFGNLNFSISEGSKPMDGHDPTEIFPLGKKDHIPSFTMRSIEDGKYAVSFHAQLSSLQAFSICVAILHSTFLGHDNSRLTLQSDSLRVFPEEEIKNLIDALSEDEKLKSYEKTGQILPRSFVLNPPFSPIARV